MRIVVALKQVPDLVEELALSADGTDIDRESVKFLLNEFDEQALEEAICLKEANGGEVVAVAFDEPEVDWTLYSALARGADRAVKLAGAGGRWLDGYTRASMLASWLAGEAFDLVLTGVQAADDLDGQLAALLGARMELPHVSVVVRLEGTGPSVTLWQELGGGTLAEEEVELPAVIGIQSARQPPRYVAIGRLRQVREAGGIEEVELEAPGPPPGARWRLRRLLLPEASAHAEMLTGSTAEVAGRIVELLRAKGLVRS